jgi:hypothetical protein
MGAPAPNVEREGVETLKIASLIGVVYQALFWVGILLFDLIFNAVSGCTPATGALCSYPGYVSVDGLYAGVGLLIAGAVVGVVCWIFYYLGFRKIRQAAADFGAPTTLVLVGLIGLLMVAGGIALFVGAIATVIACAPSATTSCAGVALGSLLGGLALVGLGALLALIGVIGVLLGNWRAGTRYNDSMVKIGGILQILPFLSIVGFVLCLVGYSSISKKLASGWTPATVTVTIPNPAAQYSPPAPAYGAPVGQPMAPAGAAGVAAATGTPNCPRCARPATYVPQYNRYYCQSCAQYV